MMERCENALLHPDRIRPGLGVDGQTVDRTRRDFVIGRIRNLDIIRGADVVEDAGLEFVVDPDDREPNAVDVHHLPEAVLAAEETALERLADQSDPFGVFDLGGADAPPFAQGQRIDDIILLADHRADERNAVGLQGVVPLKGREDVAHRVRVFGQHGRGVAVLDLGGGWIVLTRIG